MLVIDGNHPGPKCTCALCEVRRKAETHGKQEYQEGLQALRDIHRALITMAVDMGRGKVVTAESINRVAEVVAATRARFDRLAP